MAKIRTHYQNLKVDPKAPDSVIKAGYRAMSLKYHPDRRASDPDAERLFKLIQESYEILSDPIKRRKHDDWIARQEAKTTQQRKYQDEAKDRRNRERDTHKDNTKKENTKKENKSNYTAVRKKNYFPPASVVFLIFAIGSTYQMWEWSRTGVIEDFLDQYLDRRIDTVSTEEVGSDETSGNFIEDSLLDFYEKANGDNWTNNDGWGVGDYCTWYGITCDGVEVIEIRLQSNNLVGTISEELSHLTSLKILHINKNELSGFIPAELGDLANIVNLHLGENRFSGSIPAELGNLPNLTYLSLADNELSGSIPLHLGNLTNLGNLFLMNNQLTGSIPPELGNLTRLSLFGLSNNRLSGSIPTELGNLTNLYRLWLDNNLLSGSVPEFLNEMDLETLDLEGNNFDAQVSISQELTDSLNTLNEWHENGLLTDEELELAKRKILQ